MRFAIVGTRGIPGRYGGFETFAEELSTRLTARGHTLTVYCRERHTEPAYRGVRLQYLPTIRHKYLDTIAHTFLSTHAPRRKTLRGHKQDAVLYCNAANAVFTWIPACAGHARGVECGRAREKSQEVEPGRESRGTGCRSGWRPGCPTQ